MAPLSDVIRQGVAKARGKGHVGLGSAFHAPNYQVQRNGVAHISCEDCGRAVIVLPGADRAIGSATEAGC